MGGHCSCKDYWEGKELSEWSELETKCIGPQKYLQEFFKKQKLKGNVTKSASGIKVT